MSQTNHEKVFDALAIRNTSPQDSAIANNDFYTVKTMIIENGLNQSVTLQCKASYDGASHWFDVGSSFDVAASTDTYQTSTAYFPFMKLVATCPVAPTSGSLTVILCRVT
jgi:hypothetical protein